MTTTTADKPSLDDLAVRIAAWQTVTFPRGNLRGRATHLHREAGELLKAIETIASATLATDVNAVVAAHENLGEELADLFHLLVAVADEAHVDLADAVAEKFDKNRARTWGKPDADGVVEHIAEGGDFIGGDAGPNLESTLRGLADKVEPASSFVAGLNGKPIEVVRDDYAPPIFTGDASAEADAARATVLGLHPLPWTHQGHNGDVVDSNGCTIFDTRGDEEVALVVALAVNAFCAEVEAEESAPPADIAEQRRNATDLAAVTGAARAQAAAAAQVEATSPSLLKLGAVLACINRRANDVVDDDELDVSDSMAEIDERIGRLVRIYEQAGLEGERGRHADVYEQAINRLSVALGNVEGTDIATAATEVVADLKRFVAENNLAHGVVVVDIEPNPVSVVVALFRAGVERAAALGLTMSGFTTEQDKTVAGYIVAGGPASSTELQKAWALIDIDEAKVDTFAVVAEDGKSGTVDIDGLRRQVLLSLLDERHPHRLGHVLGVLNPNAGRLLLPWKPLVEDDDSDGLDDAAIATNNGFAGGLMRRHAIDDLTAEIAADAADAAEKAVG